MPIKDNTNINAIISNAEDYKSGYNASTNTPDLDVAPSSSIRKGDQYNVTVAGTFFTIPVEVNDVLMALIDNPTTEADWLITQGDILPLLATQGAAKGSMQDMQDLNHSTGVYEGGSISDDGDGTITVSSGNGTIRATDSGVAGLYFTSWVADSGVNVTLIDNALNYIYVEYNGGSPRVIATSVKRTDLNTNIYLGSVYRTGTELHITSQSRISINDHAALMVRRMNATDPTARESGGVLYATGTRNIGVTTGVFWYGFNRFTTPVKDTSGANTFKYSYRDGLGGWTGVTSQTQINNLNYDNGSGTLAALTVGKYGVHWVYIDVDGDLHVVYGQGDYTLVEAQAVKIPGDVPPYFQDHAILVGRIIIGQAASAFTAIESAFGTTFSGGSATDHGNLLGLSDNDHPQYLPKAGGTMTGNLVVDGVTESVDASPITVSANPEVLDITHKTILQRRLRTGTAEVFSLSDPTLHNGKSFSVFLHQVATGNPVATSVTFTGADPGDAGTFVVSNLNDKVDLVNFVCLNNKWYMSAIKGYGI
jgi:hypothetical protein